MRCMQSRFLSVISSPTSLSLPLPPSPSPPLSLSPPSLFLSIYMHATTIPHCNAGPLQLSKMVPETDKERREHVIDVSPCIGQT